MLYLVFAFQRFYPKGGVADLKSKHSTLAAATSAAIKEWKKQFPGGKLPGPGSNRTPRDAEAHVLRVTASGTRKVYTCGGLNCRID